MTTPDFPTFWNAYALKRDRIAAERAWKKLSVRDRRAALAGIRPYTDACTAQGINRMYPQGYLTHRRWEDEPAAPASASSPGGTPDPLSSLAPLSQSGTAPALTPTAILDRWFRTLPRKDYMTYLHGIDRSMQITPDGHILILAPHEEVRVKLEEWRPVLEKAADNMPITIQLRN